MKYRLGIDIGGTKIAYGIVNENGVIVYRHRTPTEMHAKPERFLQTLVGDINGILEAQNFSREDLLGMALGFPSYVDYKKGVVVRSGSMENLCGFHASGDLRRYFPTIRTIVDNDANIAAVAEHKFGAGRGHDHMLYTAVSTGIGSGFILNGRIYRGAYGGAGESGHMLITPDEGVTCGCQNRGCFMGNVAGSMIAKQVREAIGNGRDTIMKDLVEGDIDKITAAHVNEAFKMGDAYAAEIVEKMGFYLGVYVYNFFVGLNLDCYVFGGGMIMNFGDELMDRIKRTFYRYNHYEGQKVYFKYAELGGDAGILGAAELLLTPDNECSLSA